MAQLTKPTQTQTITLKPRGAPIRVVLPDGSVFMLTTYGHPDRPDRHGLLVTAANTAETGALATECTVMPQSGNAVVLRATR